jgi:hypothetical protein
LNAYREIWPDLVADGPYEFWELIDADGVLTLRLRGRTADVVLTFDAYISYRRYDESDAMATLKAIRETSSLGKWFYAVDPSDYALWLVHESRGIRHDTAIPHYAIVCSNDIVDVLSPVPPAILVEPRETGG